ncbi:TetR/AcrR family transcriptional regulator [Rhodocyclus tenuis]|uniref:TetR family transcriptional regulator n=2 Tax=Rhodocyclus TaxID=1064 RepID=A0A6L5JXP7_RHOTE|nr:TetR/AcrR family transcriptional regulator [Rhodocyclus gracilis]MQY50958.1 TetR family transcriptional regulator [Rhodocyclus gracilis]MRD72932.1 TetR family transcriptional regulator [Rhodocyclus gracilis]NJA88668.1 TetR/AcrR family transcriptional regulator [Rhodocyclus gracilis]
MDVQHDKPRQPLERQNWIDAAFDVLADQGIDGLRVETLAKRCGVTKGSFYWHFKDRQDLCAAILDDWKDGRIRDINRQTASDPGHEREQLQRVIEVYSAARNRKGVWIELAVRDWARRDEGAARIVEEVDAWRLECTRKLFVNCGYSDDEARSRSLLLYAYVFGQSLMAYDRQDPKNSDFKLWIADRILRN